MCVCMYIYIYMSGGIKNLTNQTTLNNVQVEEYTK